MTDKVRVVSFGIGVIGSTVAKTIIQTKSDWMEIVGAIDIDQNKVGKNLGQVVGAEPCGITISDEVESVLKKTNPDIVIHTTSSYLKHTAAEIERIVGCGVDVISSCEELTYPKSVNAQLADELDRIAKKKGVSILGTGINPGFLMDALPIVLTSPCLEMESIKVKRQMNAANRRIPFQKKIGAGMSQSEFTESVRSKKISGHVGLEQSIALLSDALGWKLDELNVGEAKSVVQGKKVRSGWIEVEAGRVTGLTQNAFGIIGERKVIDYEFTAYIGAEEEFDLVEIKGTPSFTFKSTPCVNGDTGTVAMLINMIPKVMNSSPGLLTMRDLTLPSAANLRAGTK